MLHVSSHLYRSEGYAVLHHLVTESQLIVAALSFKSLSNRMLTLQLSFHTAGMKKAALEQCQIPSAAPSKRKCMSWIIWALLWEIPFLFRSLGFLLGYPRNLNSDDQFNNRNANSCWRLRFKNIDPEICCLQKSGLSCLQCLKWWVGQSLGVFPSSIMDLRNVSRFEVNYTFHMQFLFRQIAIFSNLQREKLFFPLCCNMAKNSQCSIEFLWFYCFFHHKEF